MIYCRLNLNIFRELDYFSSNHLTCVVRNTLFAIIKYLDNCKK